MNTYVSVPPSGDGGFPTGLPGNRVTRGTPARWDETKGWTDRDGLPLPNPMLVIGHTTILRRWKNHKPEDKTEHPLANPDELNAAIPVAEWERGKNGEPEKPWKFTYVVYLVDLKTGSLFTYANHTYGAMLAYANLEEQIAIMRMLRGEHIFPIVRLERRPMKTAFGMKTRPHFHPIDWRAPGGSPVMPQAPTPQISGPSTTTPPAFTPTTPATPSSTPSIPTAPPPAAAASAAPAPTILDHTKPVKPVTIGEAIADELPPWA
jgi:hypothetical protein